MLKTFSLTALLLAATPAMAQFGMPLAPPPGAPIVAQPLQPVQPYQAPQIQMQPVQRPLMCTQTCFPVGHTTQCTTTCN